MLVYYDKSLEQETGRTHPWTISRNNPSHRYYDFRKQPEMIRTSLEDFLPLGDDPAAIRFYELMEWLNGPESLFETNDSGMRPVQPNPDAQFPQKMRVTARIHVFLREYSYNITDQHVLWLTGAFHHDLKHIDPGWESGCIGLASLPTLFEAIPEDQKRMGWIHELHFFAFGDDERETLNAFARCCENVLTVCKAITARLYKDLARQGSA